MIRTFVWWILYVLSKMITHRPRMTVLLYHSISNSSDFFAVSPDMFERQMQYIAKYGAPVPLSRAFAHAQGDAVTRDSVAITFDDGYKDFVTNALPILEKYNIPATVFLLSGMPSRADLGNDHSLLTTHDAKELRNPLVTIGSHGATHRKITKLSDSDAEQELVGSRTDIEKMFGVLPTYFAYPKGSFNKVVAEHARETEYAGAVTVIERGVRAGDSLFMLPRVQVDSRTTETIFKAKLSKTADWYYQLWSLQGK